MPSMIAPKEYGYNVDWGNLSIPANLSLQKGPEIF